MFARYTRPLTPPWWVRGGQRQTLVGYFLPVPHGAPDETAPGITRREIDVGGGDRIVVFDAAPLAPQGGEPGSGHEGELAGMFVHLFHGLTGSSESNYMRIAAAALRSIGAHVRLYNHRGQGAGEGLARGIYHSGSDLDLFASVEDARRVRPDALHLGVGFSLSANTLLLGMARRPGHQGMPDAAIAVNPPVDLLAAVDRIAAGFNRVYDRNFVRGMRRSLKNRQAQSWIDPGLEIPRGASVRAADGIVTAPLAGYRSAEEYYADCSSGPRLASVERPAMVLHAGDDPFIAGEDVERAVRGTSVVAHIEAVGGHLGYVGRGRERWLAGALQHYAREVNRGRR